MKPARRTCTSATDRRLAAPNALALTLLASLLAACGGEPADGGAQGGSWVLGDGVETRVSAGGTIEVSLDGRSLWSTSSAPITLRTFDTSVQSLFGTWAFTRDNEQLTPLPKLVEGVRDGDGVRVAFAKGAARVTLRFQPLRAGATLIRVEPSGVEGLGSVALPLRCDADASFYGFGEQYDATDQRGHAFGLFVSEQGIGRTGEDNSVGLSGGPHSTYYPMPYFLDARGSGTLVRTARRTLVDLCKGDESTAWVEVETSDPFELVVFHGPAPDDVIRQLGDEVGRPARLPKWAFGPWVSVQGGRDVVLAAADALEQAKVPVTAIWSQDWTGQRTNVGGGYGVQYRWVADEKLYPDLPGMVSTLHARNIKFLAYVNPFVMPALDHFAEMDAAGLLLERQDGTTYKHASPAGDASHPDLSNPAARDYVKGFLAKMVKDVGIDGWMADFAEWVPIDSAPSDGSEPLSYHNRYPVEWHRLSREVLEEQRPNGDFAVFSRSGWSGDQGASQITWAGDQEATWSPTDGLPTVVPALLNLGVSGVPFSTHDIGGFSGGPRTKELFLRWTELGAFTPIMRTHEGNKRSENWQWDGDAETVAHFARFARVHQALVPTFEALADEAATTSRPIIRHLMLEFPNDPGSRPVSDQFLLGPDLLVAPVTTEGASGRNVYLPPGTWFHVWTGKEHAGGASLFVEAPVGSPPVFSRGADRPDLRAIQ